MHAHSPDCLQLQKNSLEHIPNNGDSRPGWPAIWAAPALLPLVAAVLIDAGEKQVLVWFAAITLSLPYIAGAALAWRKWRSHLRSVAVGCAAAVFAYVTLILLARALLG